MTSALIQLIGNSSDVTKHFGNLCGPLCLYIYWLSFFLIIFYYHSLVLETITITYVMLLGITYLTTVCHVSELKQTPIVCLKSGLCHVQLALPAYFDLIYFSFDVT